MKSRRRVREILEAFAESRLQDDGEYKQREPYSYYKVVAYFEDLDVEIVGVGFSNRQEGDRFDSAFGLALARRRAIADVASQLRRHYPRYAMRIAGR